MLKENRDKNSGTNTSAKQSAKQDSHRNNDHGKTPGGFFTRTKLRLGIGLPARNLPLEFDLPGIGQRPKKPVMEHSAIRQQLSGLVQANPIFLKQVSKDLLTLNYYPMQVRTRLQLLSVYVENIQIVTNSVIANCSTRMGIPEEKEKTDLLEALLKVSNQLLMGYQRIFCEIYHLSQIRYAKFRDLLALSAYRMLEILHLQQHINAILLRHLPGKSWYCANKIFHILAAYENVDDSFEPTFTFRSDSTYSKGLEARTIKDLYVAIQLFGYVDALHFNPQDIGVVSSYLKEVAKKIQPLKTFRNYSVQIDGDIKQIVDQQQCLISHDQNTSADLLTINKSHQLLQGDSLQSYSTLDLVAFAKQLEDDFISVDETQNGKTVGALGSRLLRQIDDSRRLSIITDLKRAVQFHGSYRYRSPQMQPLDIMLYSGFADCFSFQRDKDSQRLPMRALEDQLATRSSVINIGQPGGQESHWYGMHNDEHHLVIRVVETAYTLPLQIGRLVLYALQTDQRIPRLGYVTRLQRFDDRQVVINIKKLSIYNEAVVICDNSGVANNKLTAFLLVYEKAWHILLNRTVRAFKGQDILLRRLTGETECELGKLALVTSEFVVYQLLGEKVKELTPLNLKQTTPHKNINSLLGI